MKHQPKKHYDIAYDGYATAINRSPMLKNSMSGHKLATASGMPLVDVMRNIATTGGNIRKQKAEEERRKQEARLAELGE